MSLTFYISFAQYTEFGSASTGLFYNQQIKDFPPTWLYLSLFAEQFYWFADFFPNWDIPSYASFWTVQYLLWWTSYIILVICAGVLSSESLHSTDSEMKRGTSFRVLISIRRWVRAARPQPTSQLIHCYSRPWLQNATENNKVKILRGW